MPELPDVEILKQYLDATSLHQEIEQVEVHSRQVLEDVTAQELEAGLEGRAFESTRRWGKYLFVELDDGHWLVLHFGMTGNLKYFKDMDEDTAYDRLLICFSNGYHLVYDAQRKLGAAALIEDVERFIEEKGWGPDVLDRGFDLAAFKEILAGRRGMVKSTLMNQHIMAGIGNVYSDEILFQSGIHPRTRFNQLDELVLEELFQAMKEVLQMAIERRAEADSFPDSYIAPHRRGDGKCPRCGHELQRVKVSGRSAYFCPHCQGRQP